MRSIARLAGANVVAPCFSTLSRRSAGLPARRARRLKSHEPIYLVVDSSGLKIFGAGEWQAQKYGTGVKRRRWRKLHIGFDLVSGDIMCSELTQDDVGDPTTVPALLNQIEGPVAKFLADGA